MNYKQGRPNNNKMNSDMGSNVPDPVTNRAYQ